MEVVMTVMVMLVMLVISLLLPFFTYEHFNSEAIALINKNDNSDFRKLLPKLKSLNDVNNEEANTDIKVYTYYSKDFIKGVDPAILIVGSVHGNEPAGSVACYKLIDELNKNSNLRHIKVTIIPVVNQSGLLDYKRTMNGIDINRMYHLDKPYNKVVKDAVMEADIICDSHEGHGYYLLNGTFKQLAHSMGSTITAGSSSVSNELANKIVSYLNETLNLKEHKRFSVYPDIYIKGTLRELCNKLNKHYILIETTGQNEIQDIHVRRDQHLLVYTFLISLS